MGPQTSRGSVRSADAGTWHFTGWENAAGRWFRGPIGSRHSGWVGDVGSEDLVASGRMTRVLVCLRPLSPLRTCPSERHEPCPHADAVPLTPDKKQETPQPWPSRSVSYTHLRA